MFGLQHISVDFLSGQPIWVVSGLLALLGLAIWLYWRTNPPLPRWLRVTLGVLRVVAVLALILALLEPTISYSRRHERPPRLSILVDHSASMNRIEHGRSRLARADSLLSGDLAGRLFSACDVNTYYFGANLSDQPNAIDTNGTALGEVLRELDRRQLEQPADCWLILSDGNSNSGPIPSEVMSSLRTPIVSVGMAADTGIADIGITGVDYNAVMFVGQPSEFKAKLRWDGVSDRQLRVQLLDSGRVAAETPLAIEQASGLAEVDLRFTPNRPGQTLLSIRVAPLEDEPDTDNNSRTVSVKVLKSRVNVLIACESPDYEIGFLNRYLRQSDRYEVELLVLGRQAGNLAGRFPVQQTELNRYDLVILYDPEPSRLDILHGLLKSYLSERGGGLWVILGSRYGRGSYRQASELLPFYSSQRPDIVFAQFHGLPAEGELFHPAVRLADSRTAIRDAWAGLPPFQMLAVCDRLAAGAVALAFASGGSDLDSRLPILGYRRLGPGKVLALAATPLWKWGFETLSYGADQAPYARLIDGAVTWLTVQDDFDPIRVAPDQPIYRRGEPIRFEGIAFDPGFRPITGVYGSVTLSHISGKDTLETDLIESGEGSLRAEFANVPPGEYAYEASLLREQQLLKTSRGKVLVESFSVEEVDQRGDPATLVALAEATGGEYHTFADFTSQHSVSLEPVTETVEREIVLWGKLWLLLVFIGTLALEWGLRKFNHLL
jgi:hypothetical protein